MQSMGITVLVALSTTAAAYPVAYFLAFIAHRRRYVLLLVLLAPFFTSFLLRVLAWQVMLNNNGVINSPLWELRPAAAGRRRLLADQHLVLGRPGARLLVDPVRGAADLRRSWRTSTGG